MAAAGCCGSDEETMKQPGVAPNRRCRDILCTLFFLAFWAGMFIICGIAFREGEASRLVYGVDSYGYTCGSTVTFSDNSSLDLSRNRNLYWLNPLELLKGSSSDYAKKVCVPSCPFQQYNITQNYCLDGRCFVCPYYRFAEYGLNGKLPASTPPEATQYFVSLASIPVIEDPNAPSFIQRFDRLRAPFGDLPELLSLNASSTSTRQTGRYYQLTSQVPGNGPCYPIDIATVKYFNRCFPDFPENVTRDLVDTIINTVEDVAADAIDAIADQWNDGGAKWSRYVGDISKGILIIVIAGLIGGIIFSTVWVILLRFAAGLVVWLAIIVTNLAMIGVTLYAWAWAGYIGDNALGSAVKAVLPGKIDPTKEERDTWFAIAIAVSIVTGIVFIITLLCISRVRIAVAVIKVATQAINCMPSILFFPLLPFVFEVGLIIYWIAVAAMLYSAGDLTANCRSANRGANYAYDFLANVTQPYTPSNLALNATTTSCYKNVTNEERSMLCGADPNCFLSYNWNDKLKYSFIYHVFGLLWTQQVIVGFSCVTVAGAVAHYYWAKGQRAAMPSFPVLAALKNTVVWHMGSVCFGAFIVAIVQFIRFLLEYLDRKTREIQEANSCAQWMMCCVKCCMWCLEKIVMFINRNAYIMVAVKGTGYCQSACRAVYLLVSNALRITVVTIVTDVLLFMGKLSVAALAGLCAFGLSEANYFTNPTKYPDTYLSSPVMPIVVSFIVAFIIAEIFLSVYEMAVETILLAFCDDCEAHDGEPTSAPPLLMEALGQVPPVKKDKDNKA